MNDGDTPEGYEVAVVGAGPAGLTAALYAVRLGHDAVVIDRGGGRAAMMIDTHNVIGVPEDVSGKEFLETARDQVEAYGAEFRRSMATSVERVDDGSDPRFRIETSEGPVRTRRVVFATGFTDGHPDPPLPRTGRGLHYCLHCDAYMFIDRPVFVMGHGNSAAHVAMIMLNFTPDVDLLLDGDDPTWSEDVGELLRGHPVDVVETEVTGTYQDPDDPEWLGGFEFADGTSRDYRGGFAMYGSDYNNDLARDLGCAINDDGTVEVDDDGLTTVDGAFAVGDLTRGHNQIPVAMGEGARTGIAIHYSLREFPRSLEEISEEGTVDPGEVPAISDRLHREALAFRGEDNRATGDD